MRNIKLTIEYDGTNYCGWQVQKNGISIQEVIQTAIESLVFHKIDLTGSSRTDAGVHARGMVANFFTSSSIPEERFAPAINCKLPRNIVIVKSQKVNEDFHSRYCSVGKKYSYTILNRKSPSPLLRNYSAHVPVELDLYKMKQATKYFMGTHDFSAFKSSGSSVKSSIRTISLLEIEQNNDTIKIYIIANGFLYNMVRIIAGTLIDIGKSRISPDDINEIILSRDRENAGKTAPAQGLVLECVYYNK